MPINRAQVAWTLGLFSPIAMGGRAEARNITGAQAFGPDSLKFFTINELDTGDANNDNSADPILNRFNFSKGFLTPAPIDIEVTVVNEADSPGTTEYLFDGNVTNKTTRKWLGFHHQIGFGIGDDFELAPSSGGLDFDIPQIDPPPSSGTFAIVLHGARRLEWRGGPIGEVQPGGSGPALPLNQTLSWLSTQMPCSVENHS